MLPGFDGFEVCRRLRQFTDAYVLMLTAPGEEIDRIVGLEVGADDYLTKPFSPRELVARGSYLRAGGLAMFAGLTLLLGVASFILQTVGVVLVLVGFDSILTGVTGYCPIYGLLDKSGARPHDSRANT